MQVLQLGEEKTAAQKVDDAISAFLAAAQTVEDNMAIAENELFAGNPISSL